MHVGQEICGSPLVLVGEQTHKQSLPSRSCKVIYVALCSNMQDHWKKLMRILVCIMCRLQENFVTTVRYERFSNFHSLRSSFHVFGIILVPCNLKALGNRILWKLTGYTADNIVRNRRSYIVEYFTISSRFLLRGSIIEERCDNSGSSAYNLSKTGQPEDGKRWINNIRRKTQGRSFLEIWTGINWLRTELNFRRSWGKWWASHSKSIKTGRLGII